ncbi:MAG: hypothetical protein E6370_17340 [Clostridiales bacterium]|nr:hypothetical protein [Clostridiales bacterium]MDU6976033.1 hypothetical protein [Clostridiales bacterium]
MAPLILLSKRNLNGGMKMYKTFEGTMITGASDDLIEIEGELVEEFDCFNCKNGTLACSDGTLLTVDYDKDGLWRFGIRFKGSLFDKKEEGSVDEDTNDKVFFKPGMKWIVFHEEASVAVR